jgi:hypothetical protein
MMIELYDVGNPVQAVATEEAGLRLVVPNVVLNL